MTSDEATRPPSHRERLRQVTLDDIRAAALRQIRQQGAQALSLRAVARDVGMSNPGLYRYYASREELLTALVADAFDDLGAALERARDGRPAADLAGQLRAAMLAYFAWGVDHQVEFDLIFGSPVPGYAAPTDGPTTAAAARFSSVLVGLVHQAWETQGGPVPPTSADRRGATTAEPGAAVAIARLWSRLHGILALSLPGHLGHIGLDGADVEELYRAEVEHILAELTVT